MRRSKLFIGLLFVGLLFSAAIALAGGRAQTVNSGSQTEGYRPGSSQAFYRDSGTTPIDAVDTGDLTATGSGAVGDGIGVIESITCGGYTTVSVWGYSSADDGVFEVAMVGYVQLADGTWRGREIGRSTLTANSDFTEDSLYTTNAAFFDTAGFGLCKVLVTSVSSGDELSYGAEVN